MLNHGGKLEQARQQYPQQTEWLDVSTGIAPWSWPVPAIPELVWQRLPESDVSLREAAAAFYQCDAAQLLSVAGSQMAIEAIPRCVPAATVAVPLWGYGEHRLRWSQQGHSLCVYRDYAELLQLLQSGRARYAVVINPCNPGGEHWTLAQLQTLAEALPATGLLVVDEAFADLDAGQTHSATRLQHGRLVVLRSVGKFFGMAGLRLGFVHAATWLRQALQPQLPLWGVSHPALWLGERMLRDRDWQAQQRARIHAAQQRLLQLLHDFLPVSWQARVQPGPLFVTLRGDTEALQALHEQCLQAGVLVRYFAAQAGESCLRLGLAHEHGWSQLQRTLMRCLPQLDEAADANHGSTP